jgi:hypothetical protein
MASVFGNTKLASADAIKATEPSMLIHAINQGSDLDRRCHNPTPRAESAKTLATRNRMEPKMSGRQTCLSASATVRLCAVAANVLMLKKSVPGNCVTAASQFLSPAPPGPRQRPDTGVLALLVYFRHPRTLNLYQLEVRRLGKEDGSHKEGNGVRGRPDRVYISGDRPQGKTRSADHEQPGDSRVETYRLYAHAPAFGLRLSALQHSQPFGLRLSASQQHSIALAETEYALFLLRGTN